MAACDRDVTGYRYSPSVVGFCFCYMYTVLHSSGDGEVGNTFRGLVDAAFNELRDLESAVRHQDTLSGID